MNRKYYILVGKERCTGVGFWELLFGDYDKETVQYEGFEVRESYPDEYSAIKIIGLVNDTQEMIDKRVRKLNSEEGILT